MIRKCFSRLSYSNIVATVALFFALGGTSYALIVNGALVQDESLTDADVRDGSLAAAIATDAVTGANVEDDSLTRDDIDEATLGSPRVLGSEGAGHVLRADGVTEVADRVAVGSGKTASVTATVMLTNTNLHAAHVVCAILDHGDGKLRILGRRAVTLPGSTIQHVVDIGGATTTSLGEIVPACTPPESGVIADAGWLAAVVR